MGGGGGAWAFAPSHTHPNSIFFLFPSLPTFLPSLPPLPSLSSLRPSVPLFLRFSVPLVRPPSRPPAPPYLKTIPSFINSLALSKFSPTTIKSIIKTSSYMGSFITITIPWVHAQNNFLLGLLVLFTDYDIIDKDSSHYCSRLAPVSTVQIGSSWFSDVIWKLARPLVTMISNFHRGTIVFFKRYHRTIVS